MTTTKPSIARERTPCLEGGYGLARLGQELGEVLPGSSIEKPVEIPLGINATGGIFGGIALVYENLAQGGLFAGSGD